MLFPRRSLHFVPGGQTRMFDKALGLAADTLILDLEDAVTPERKEAARGEVVAWLAALNGKPVERMVRANPLNSPWGLADLEALLSAPVPPHSLLVPKVSHAEELRELDAVLSRLEAARDTPCPPLSLMIVATETAAGALNLPQTAAAPRVSAVTWGAEDLSAVLGAQSTRDGAGRYWPVFTHCRLMTLLSASAAGCQPIDGVYTQIRDGAGLAEECAEAAAVGFRGKMSLHPDQIPIINAAFTPSEAVIAAAEGLLEAFRDAQKAGKMAFSYEGEMVDAPHLARAEATLALAQGLGLRPHPGK
ncbi:MAG: CoA ester lyase [Pseudomonadales bacterium]|nr:CoA ester lyase [Pseudomonadales bacterium]MDA0955253.1 CoA ester lyase [Pseudomonadota bacterium]